jgi:S1-C subfamily serine protease
VLVDINTNLSYEGASAAGTGIVLSATGEVLTNNHVIDGATSISVTDIGNGKTYNAHVVGYNRTSDVAVVQMEQASGLSVASTSTTPAVVGQSVVALGNAGGAGGQPSVAGGSITALNQAITASDGGSGGNSENLTGLIETNANIQPGDSGGALSDVKGHVIGINTAASTGGVVGSVTQAKSRVARVVREFTWALRRLSGSMYKAARAVVQWWPRSFPGRQQLRRAWWPGIRSLASTV